MIAKAEIKGPWGVAIATGVMTVLLLVFAEVLPKTLAIMRPDDVARFLSAPPSWSCGSSARSSLRSSTLSARR